MQQATVYDSFFADFLIGIFSPQLLQALVAAAAIAVDFIAQRVFFVIVLVVVLRGIEYGGRDNFSHDRGAEATAQSFLRFFREPLLGLIVVEDGRPILAPVIA